jgi:hypothetical protein
MDAFSSINKAVLLLAAQVGNSSIIEILLYNNTTVDVSVAIYR